MDPAKTLVLAFALERVWERSMARSRRRYKRSKPKVQVALPRKNPRIFKPAFCVPPKLRALIGDSSDPKWDDQGTVIRNYKSFGVVSNPNFLGVRSRTPQIIETDSLQVPPPPPSDSADAVVSKFEPLDNGSDVEEDGEFLVQVLLLDSIRVRMFVGLWVRRRSSGIC